MIDATTESGEPVLAIVVTGPVGAGKSTVMAAATDMLAARGISHVGIDMDYLRWVYPEPPGDSFGAELGYRNLGAMWPNLREGNPRCVVIADVVEHPAQARKYEAAMPGVRVIVARLDVPLPVILERLEGRERPETIAWYRNRAPELQGIMAREGVGDIVIDVGIRTPDDVAGEILRRAGIPRK